MPCRVAALGSPGAQVACVGSGSAPLYAAGRPPRIPRAAPRLPSSVSHDRMVVNTVAILHPVAIAPFVHCPHLILIVLHKDEMKSLRLLTG